MTHLPNAYTDFAREHGLDIFEVPGGWGIRFSDGYDVYWVLPDERWHFLHEAVSAGDASHLSVLNERRERVIDAIRRYLAKQKVAVERLPNGTWPCTREGGISEFTVGAHLTRWLVAESDLVAVMRRAFEGTYLRGPSERRAQRHLGEFGKPFEERPWPDVDDEEAIGAMSESPLAALGWMGLCKALKHESSFESPEAFAAAVEPKGRIGHALLKVAQRLPNSKASVELTDGSMCIEFSDEYDSFKIAPKSRELRDLLRAMTPEDAGDHLADEYERLNSSRSRVLDAVFGCLREQGYHLDSNTVLVGLEAKQMVGREFREFAVELGESVTNAIEESGEERAVRQALAAEEKLADAAVEFLGRTEAGLRIDERPLRPANPPKRELPVLSAEQLSLLDERADMLLRRFMETDDALLAYSNPLMWDVGSDSWADAQQWIALAQEHVLGSYPRCDAEMILIDHGDPTARERFMARLQDAEPHHEVWDQEVEMVWKLRQESPELAEKWFGPRQHEDVPYAEVRARLGDPIAACHVLGSILDEDSEHPVPTVLKDLPATLVPVFIDSSQVEKWRQAALQWAEECWEWNWGGDGEVLAVAAKMGWQEVGHRLESNPFLLPGLLDSSEDDPGVLFAEQLFLGWSKLAPSPFLMRLVGYVLSLDLERASESLARRCMGSEEFVEQHPTMPGEISDAWLGKIGVALAISWHRCRNL